ncbi:hypothetical protein Q4Q34_08255 [Flavivirga abyssicola]|uniref:hypothetical protein n=1 Tax=Flavivirga abyssicola TaxID=3063533 RepID=UPI0026E0066B|nr:hypothetical protein [Flavivirga sp. MEBiC07777]WVK15019.1 hypothetical protein Q4Q34_08255 [Flavivirga sp. MEBiC07777]
MDSKNNNILFKKQVNHQKLLDKNMQKLHTEELGLSIPENYFSQSKQDILDKISDKTEHKKPVFFLKKPFVWYAAASVILLIAITIVKSNNSLHIDNSQTIVLDTIKQLDKTKFESDSNPFAEDDILVTSLFIEENDIDEFIDNYVLEEALLKEAL